MAIPAIPTLYNNVQFRSRLEARWAAFFDQVGWRWDYEPVDFKGWIPDFALYGRSYFGGGLEGLERIFVEVKPVKGEDDPLFIATRKEIEANLKEGEALIVTDFFPEIRPGLFGDDSHPAVGWLGDLAVEEPYWELAPFGIWEGSAKVGFCHKYQSYHDRISSLHEHVWAGGAKAKDVRVIVDAAWKAAGTAVQWNPPQGSKP